jgi:TolB protein
MSRRRSWGWFAAGAAVALAGALAALAAAPAIPVRGASRSLGAGRIAYVVVHGGAGDIALLRVGGGRSRLIAGDWADEENPAWSPDGRSIVLQRVAGDVSTLEVVAAAGGLALPLTRGGHSITPAWAPSGRIIAYADRPADGSYSLYVLDLRTGWSRRLSHGHGRGDTSPTFSPDGRDIAFARSRGAGSEIWIIPAGGGRPRRLTRTAGDAAWPAWSPDGRLIAFSSSKGIAVVPADGGRPRRLTPPGVYAVRPVWSPDGRALAYWGDSPSGVDVYAVALRGGQPRRLTRSGAAMAPSWAPETPSRERPRPENLVRASRRLVGPLAAAVDPDLHPFGR